jgi:hypothetical protein
MASHSCLLCNGTLKDPIKLKAHGRLGGKGALFSSPYSLPFLVEIDEAIMCITARVKEGLVIDPRAVEIACDVICKWKYALGDPSHYTCLDKMRLERMDRLESAIVGESGIKSASKT